MARERWMLVCCLGFAIACAGANESALPPGQPDPADPEAKARIAARYDDALERFGAHDRRGSWTEESCNEVAALFEAVAARTDGAAQGNAAYNAGLAYQRCALFDKARAAFARSRSHQAQAELALADFAAGASVEATIARLDAIVRAAKFQNVSALVALAALQMERGAKGDLDAARANLQRALAIDDGHMPALNQLALYYLALARREGSAGEASGLVLAGSEERKAKRQTLDLAALVVSQALRKHARYAPLHNTAGLIQVELESYNAAVASFRRAREIDPRFYEAHMNYAAVSLAIRGFAQAEAAYRSALGQRPDDYEAHVGLALALRGRATLASETEIRDARQHLARAQRIAPERPEAYYNEAILLEEYEAKRAEGKPAIAILKRAKTLYAEFSRRAGSAPRYAVAVERARLRSSDIDLKIEFLK